MHLATFIMTKLTGKFVGTDEFGNRYYESSKEKGFHHKKKRWVQYKGSDEPTKVPPSWHGWLHYVTDEIPKDKYNWQQEHTSNNTGTKVAYFPKGHKKGANQRAKVASDFEEWKP